MAKKIQQIRYYGENNKSNYPTNLTAQRLRAGTAFSDYYPIVQLGIQTLPGVRVFINNHTSPIIIGGTGIYELNVDGLSNITDLSFDPASLNLINANDNASLIIDFIYEGEG